MLPILAVLAVLAAFGTNPSGAERSFRVDYNKNVFLKDGQPYRYISGEMHYFRIHPTLWEDRLQRVRHAGLNAVQVYIPWNFHENIPGMFDFESPGKNLTQFILLAQQNELDVLLRIGPYACAEWEFGGLPWWLLRYHNIELRTSDKTYLGHVKQYFNVLLPLLKPLLHKNGGPVIMMQIENEYGSVLCDKTYLRWLRDEVHGQLGNDTQLYTTDGYSDSMLKCGSVEGVFTTVDFGTQGKMEDVQSNFAMQQKYSQGGPHVNSEFYTVWFSGWGDKSPPMSDPKSVIAQTLQTMEWMWNMNASFSFYMIHGGTNFGFWNGAETNGPVITSYDYSAPISEEGQITPMYIAIRDWIKMRPNWSNKPLDIPRNHTSRSLNADAVRIGDLIDIIKNTIDEDHCRSTDQPIAFEELDQPYTWVLYSTILSHNNLATRTFGFLAEENVLKINGLNDYASVFVDGKIQGYMWGHGERTPSKENVTLNNAKAGSKLDILLESHGRLTYPTRPDPKGILQNVTLNGKLVTHWLQCGVDPDRLYSSAKRLYHHKMKSITASKHIHPSRAANDNPTGIPSVYVSSFDSSDDWNDYHTFFDSRGWSKGNIIINGFNVGRYWPAVGPQMTLFVPGAIFRKKNVAVVIELQGRQPKSDSNVDPEADNLIIFGQFSNNNCT
ncbi:glycosyl hydrolases family 35 domain-containing protein [Ditylenchus destructor]|nr:glycosyl hydrolases family 35 domain-containing protein [Ditylenchus destructor]